MSGQSQGGGWWLASDGKWYPPESHPLYVPPPLPGVPYPAPVLPGGRTGGRGDDRAQGRTADATASPGRQPQASRHRRSMMWGAAVLVVALLAAVITLVATGTRSQEYQDGYACGLMLVGNWDAACPNVGSYIGGPASPFTTSPEEQCTNYSTSLTDGDDITQWEQGCDAAVNDDTTPYVTS